MEKGKFYLVIEKDSKKIKEWECLEVSNVAFKVQNIVGSESSSSIFEWGPGINQPFWVLKTDVDSIGQTKHKIIDTLEKINK